MDAAFQTRDKHPDKIPVIVEKTGESDVPDLDKHEHLAPAGLNIGQFVSMLHETIKLRDHKKIFLFVNNTITPNEDLMCDIYANHKDADGYLYMTYSSEDILFAANSYLRLTDSLIHELGAKFLESVPTTCTHLLSTLEKVVSVSEAEQNQEFKIRFQKIIKCWTETLCSVLACISTKDDIAWIMKMKEHTKFEVRNHLIQSLFPRLLLHIEEDIEELPLQIMVSRENLFQDSMKKVISAKPSEFYAGVSIGNFQEYYI